MTIRVIFLCPHNAAKSVAAAAFFARDIRRTDVEVNTAGTEPDPDVLPVVRARLEDEGLHVDVTPERVTTADLERADLVVNIGCDLSPFDLGDELRPWSIPNFSDDVAMAFAAIEDHVAALVDELDDPSWRSPRNRH